MCWWGFGVGHLRAGGVSAWRSQAVGGRDGVLVPPVRPLQLLGADARLLALLQQQLVLWHLHLGGQTGCTILMSHQSLQHRRVDTEGTDTSFSTDEYTLILVFVDSLSLYSNFFLYYVQQLQLDWSADWSGSVVVCNIRNTSVILCSVIQMDLQQILWFLRSLICDQLSIDFLNIFDAHRI